MQEQKDEDFIQLHNLHTEYVEWEKVVRSKSQHLNWMRALNPEGTGAPSKSDIEAFEAVVTSDTAHLALLVRRIVHLGKKLWGPHIELAPRSPEDVRVTGAEAEHDKIAEVEPVEEPVDDRDSGPMKTPGITVQGWSVAQGTKEDFIERLEKAVDHQAQTCSALSNVALILDHRKANKGTVDGREQCELYHNQDSFLAHIAKDALTDSVGMLALSGSVLVAFRKGAREPEVLTNCEITVPKAENIGQEEVDGARHGKNTTKEEEQDVKDPQEGPIMQKEEMAKEAEKEIKTETQV